ncbi:MAG: cation:proton antiporter [Anaerolineales bacterium]|nr:cation:proton antiporter [Anaerolineales bacterium]
MHEITLLINIVIALVVAFIGGVVARRLGLPTIVGYLVAGIALGPFTPGFIGDTGIITQLAELGVIFLMFGVGLHFSLNDLWKVRTVAIPGALGQMFLTTMLAYGLSQWWGWSPASGIVLGLAVSIASTVVLLRGLIDNGLLNTPHGQAAVGWLVLEDIATVLILVLMPTLANTNGGFDWSGLIFTLLKAVAFVALIWFVGRRLIPWVLLRIAYTRSRELFILAILAITLGISLGASEWFGISFALGAFVVGVVVGESPLSHQVGADVFPFREAFTVLFFVSIGMVVNPIYLYNNIGQVLILTALIVVGKSVITLMLGLIFPWQGRTALVVASGLSQIGEFSFILGQAGIALGLLDRDQYSLILAGALLSITINPVMFRLINPTEKFLKKFPAFWKLLDRHGPAPIAPVEESIEGHVIVFEYGRVGTYIVNLLEQISIPYLVIDSDVERIEELSRRGIPSLYGDASNTEVLHHAGLKRARALVIAGHDEASSELIITAAREIAPTLPIIARATTEEGINRLAELGAQDVIHPELEGGLELVRHTLMKLGYPLQEIIRYTDAIRHDHYDAQVNSQEEHRFLHELIHASQHLDVSWVRIASGNALVGQTLAEANIRARTGASVVAIIRNNKQPMANPKSQTVFEADDRVGLIGDMEQIQAAEKLLTELEHESSQTGVEWET